MALLVGALIWGVIVPVQYFGPSWLGGYSAYLTVGMVALLLALLPIPKLITRASQVTSEAAVRR